MSRLRGDDRTQPVSDQPSPIGDIGHYDDDHLSALAALVMFGRRRPRPATVTKPPPTPDNVEDLVSAEHALAAERARCRARHPTARARLTV